MERISVASMCLGVIVLSGCVSTGPASDVATSSGTIHYSASENTKMTLCVGLTDNAFTIAQYKLAGRPAEDTKAYFRSSPQARVLVPLIEKVYGDAFTKPWDYATSFFDECASNIAQVPINRSGLAGYCMQRAMMASIAETSKESGMPKERAYQRFAGFSGDAPRIIVDGIYAHSQTRPEAMLGQWKSCMAPISGK